MGFLTRATYEPMPRRRQQKSRERYGISSLVDKLEGVSSTV